MTHDEFVRRIRIINADPRLRQQMHVERSKLHERHVLARTAVAIVAAGTEAWTEAPHSQPVARYITDAARIIL